MESKLEKIIESKLDKKMEAITSLNKNFNLLFISFNNIFTRSNFDNDVGDASNFSLCSSANGNNGFPSWISSISKVEHLFTNFVSKLHE